VFADADAAAAAAAAANASKVSSPSSCFSGTSATGSAFNMFDQPPPRATSLQFDRPPMGVKSDVFSHKWFSSDEQLRLIDKPVKSVVTSTASSEYLFISRR
jgi:hypothetical protein